MDYLRRTFSPTPEDKLAALQAQHDDLKDKQFKALAKGDDAAADKLGEKLNNEVKPAIQALLSTPRVVAKAAVDTASVAAATAHAAMGQMHDAKADLVAKSQAAASDIDYEADQSFQGAKQVASDAVSGFNDVASAATETVGKVAAGLDKATFDQHIDTLARLKRDVKAAKRVAFAAPADAAAASDEEMAELRRRLAALKSGGAKRKTSNRSRKAKASRRGRKAKASRRGRKAKASRRGRKAKASRRGRNGRQLWAAV